jgi:hypothetical protein
MLVLAYICFLPQCTITNARETIDGDIAAKKYSFPERRSTCIFYIQVNTLLVIIIHPTSVILILNEEIGIMKKLSKEWTNIIRKYLGDSWVKNEQAVLNSLIKQQDNPPISLQQAREQVERLSQQSQSAVKKGHTTME